MLTNLTSAQLSSIAPIQSDGAIVADTDALAIILSESVGFPNIHVALNKVDYDQHEDGTPEPDTRTVRGICWSSLGHDRCHKWAFRTDGRALSTTGEGEQPCPISEDADLMARAIIAIADQYPDSEIDERTARVTVHLPSGRHKKVRVVVTTDPRVVRAEDVLDFMERIAYKAGSLGVVMVTPVEGAQALVRKFGI
jgi:hypothetical protein